MPDFHRFSSSFLTGLGKPIFVQPLFASILISFHMNQIRILTPGLLIPSRKTFSADLHENRGYHEDSFSFPARRDPSAGPFRKAVLPSAGMGSKDQHPRTSSLCPGISSSSSDLSASPRPCLVDRFGLRTGEQPRRRGGLRIFDVSSSPVSRTLLPLPPHDTPQGLVGSSQ
jgi:hypothetical protein